MAKFAADNLKAKKVAILTDVKSDYSVGLAKYFKETFVKLRWVSWNIVHIRKNHAQEELGRSPP
jgi:ABC-type branched-subunit amino acid transport system substrate-binding protein